MNSTTDLTLPIPSLESLGSDLLVTSPRQRWFALARPFVGVLAYGAAIRYGWWYAAPIIVFFIFVAVVTVTHDVVHHTIGLSRRATEIALFLTGAVLLESGHAYYATHHQHHRLFPHDDDPEGIPARLSFLGAVVDGPAFLPKLWLWAYRRSDSTTQRAWLVAEATFNLIVIVSSLVFWRTLPGLLLYVTLAVIGSWVYPLLTVHLPHKNYGDTPLTQTHTLRGRIIPAIFLELTYHLEHHLYPQVPSHNLALLARRLEPFFTDAGVQPWHVP